eukprot:1391661-Amorphochlora_amoeboformis.AAC.1
MPTPAPRVALLLASILASTLYFTLAPSCGTALRHAVTSRRATGVSSAARSPVPSASAEWPWVREKIFPGFRGWGWEFMRLSIFPLADVSECADYGSSCLWREFARITRLDGRCEGKYGVNWGPQGRRVFTEQQSVRRDLEVPFQWAKWGQDGNERPLYSNKR